MTTLWARIIKKNRTIRSETIPLEADMLDALSALCALMDIPRPMLLSKHEREWADFSQTSFTQEHFVEAIPFDRLEIEQFDPDAQKKKSQDPRNG